MSSEILPAQGQFVLLLVDDDDDDVRFIEKTIKTTVPKALVLRAKDGLEAMAMLRCEAPYNQSPRPSLVLLDLNMPRMNGYEVLQAVKSEPELKSIPVVVLSTSDDAEDVAKCYALRANSYVVKPAQLSRFREVVQAIGNFWLGAARL